MVAQTEQGNNPKKGNYERLHYVTNRPFSEELQRLIDDPPLGSVPMEITPAKATEMLKRNTNNRPFTPHTADGYARQINNNTWPDTGATIVFSQTGRLLDGQHRLYACIQTGKTIKFDIKFGIDDSAFAFIDAGKKRSSGDIFAINGVKNARLMSAATSRLINLQEDWPGGARHDKQGYRYTSAEIYERFTEYLDLPLSTRPGMLFKREGDFLEGALAVALHYICAKKCRRDADVFFKMFADGIGLKSKRDPVARLRVRLIKNKTADEHFGMRKKSALTLKAWNAFRAGQTIGNLKFDDTEAFPRAH